MQIHLFSFAPRNLLQNEAGQLKVSDFGLLGSLLLADGNQHGSCKCLSRFNFTYLDFFL